MSVGIWYAVFLTGNILPALTTRDHGRVGRMLSQAPEGSVCMVWVGEGAPPPVRPDSWGAWDLWCAVAPDGRCVPPFSPLPYVPGMSLPWYMRRTGVV